jgi:hypothetical protein
VALLPNFRFHLDMIVILFKKKKKDFPKVTEVFLDAFSHAGDKRSESNLP